MMKKVSQFRSFRPLVCLMMLLPLSCSGEASPDASDEATPVDSMRQALEADPNCSASTYEAEDMFHSVGGPTPDGWNVWSNGYISASHVFEGGTTQLSAVVAGQFGGGAAPHMRITVDGDEVYQTSVGSSSWTPYGFTFEAAAGEQEIRIYFTNDYYMNGQDRNLLVDKLVVNCGTGLCGNGAVDPGEECDDGNQTSNDSCKQDCTWNACGDGALYTLLTDTNNPNPLEDCDDGNDEGGDGCSPSCTIDGICGDGVQDEGEACDDGNDVDDDECSNACTLNSTCGDGVQDEGEACDDGNDVDDDECSNACTLNSFCGDGVQDEGEACDDGNADDTDSCTSECAYNACGDGSTYQTVTLTENPNPLEECDDGNDVDDDACSNSCTINSICGDGLQDEGEECDDGNDDDTDSCTSECAYNECGDGNVYLTPTLEGNTNDEEECDDGNDVDDDACSNSCTINSFCGDGVQDEGEECDDGNDVDGDGCDSSCMLESVPSASATLSFTNQWPSGYCVTLNVTNEAAQATTGWSVSVDTQGASIYTSWNGNFSASSGEVAVTPVSWNSVIAAGATNSSVGFCANRGAGVPDPVVVSAEGAY